MRKILIIIPYEDIDESLGVRRKVIYPLEPAIVVSVLKGKGFDVRGIDLNLEFDADTLGLIKHEMSDFQPDIVLIMSQHLTFLIKDQKRIILQMLREIRRHETKIILSGPSAISDPERFLSDDHGPDIVFKGEIEDKIWEIIDAIADKSRLKAIKGVCLKEGEELFISEKISFVKELSLLPVADRYAFALERYFEHPEIENLRYPEKSRRFTQMTATRGCSTGCTFCKVKFMRREYRWRDIDHIIQEIRYLVNEKGIEEIHFLDENLLLNKSKAKRLFKRILDEKLKFHWFCGGGVAIYMLDKMLLELMKRAGCYRLHLAIESGSQRILSDIMKKPVSLGKALDIVNYARQLDFEIIGYFMIGLPSETREEILKTVRLAKNDLFDYVVFSIYTPEMGTELYDYCRENGLLDQGTDVSDLSKRAESNLLRFEGYDKDFLVNIRGKLWKEINFGDPVRREKLERMFGVTHG